MCNLSLSQKQIILGGLLGDSYFNKGKNSVRFSHCAKQLEYLEWKYNFFVTKANICSVYHTWNGNKYLQYCFEISKKYIDEDFISFIKRNLYSNDGRKKISLKYLNELDSLGLAVWWMDDGNISITKDGGNRYGKLSTHCFNYEENLLIKKYFKDKWNIDVQIKTEKNKYFIRIRASELKKLIKIIYKHIVEIPSMIYKIDLKYKYEKCIGEDFKEIYYYIENKKR